MYTDGGAFDGQGLEAIAHYYNANLQWHKGGMEGVYTLKNHTAGSDRFGAYREGAAALDVERGVVSQIRKDPFQTDTCIGQWFYWEGFKYKTAREVVHLFTDIVSKNGNMVLSIPQLPDGMIDSQEESIVDDFALWTAIHGEAIFGSRPWKAHGEGPAATPGGMFSERTMKPFTAADLRFTTKGDKLYVFCLGWPEKDVMVQSLGKKSELGRRKIEHVRVLGSEEKVTWAVEDEGLRIARPQHRPSELTLAFEIG